MTADLDTQDRLIVDELRRSLHDLVAVYRFGSSAQGATHPRSDTDLAVLARTRLPPTRRFDLQERLASLLGGDVDLSEASPVLAIQVIAHGRLLHEEDAAGRGAFEDRTFSAYARLNEQRRGILERVAAEGTVLGR